MLPLFTHILFGLRLDSSKVFWKALVIVIPFLSLKGITNVYLLKISITHNKKRIPWLNLLINCISARSIPQILYITNKYTFPFWNFLIIYLSNSSVDSSFEIFIFLIPLPEADLSPLSRVAKVSDRAVKVNF